MPLVTDLQIHVNLQETFFLNEKIISTYSGRLKKIIKHEKRTTQMKNSGIHLDDFPGGPSGFELVSRFCYNNGRITITVLNVCLLHCCAVYLGMTEKVSPFNLLQQTETFLEGMFYWSWNDVLVSLKNCESFFTYADSAGLIEKLIDVLLAKIFLNSDINLIPSCSSSSSSPETSFKTTPESLKSCSSNRASWFDDMTILPPKVIEKFLKTLGAYGSDNNSLILTKFLLHYLKTAIQQKFVAFNSSSDNGSLADTAVYGVISVGKTSFSCRKLFWVLRIVSNFGVSKDCKAGLERLIGGMLDLATLDDLLVSGHDKSVYDVNLVIRLIKVFVNNNDRRMSVQRLKKVGRLIDHYLGEIAPDQNLKISKVLRVAESLPDSFRDCFDQVYRAIDIYLQSHPILSFEERSRLCRCLNYEKLTLEACKDLGRNPRIPPRIAVQALMSKGHSSPAIPMPEQKLGRGRSFSKSEMETVTVTETDSFYEENEDMRLNLQRVQWRVMELEKVCRTMKGQMWRNTAIVAPTSALTRLC